MGERIRSVSSRRRCTGSCTRIQPDVVQHEAGHFTLRFSDGVQQRFKRNTWPSEGAVLHNSNGKRRICTDFGGDLLKGAPWRAEHGGDDERGRPFASSERSGLVGPSSE